MTTNVNVVDTRGIALILIFVKTERKRGGADMERDELFAEGLEAFACGLKIRDCPYPRKSDKGEEWAKGYYQAMHEPQKSANRAAY